MKANRKQPPLHDLRSEEIPDDHGNILSCRNQFFEEFNIMVQVFVVHCGKDFLLNDSLELLEINDIAAFVSRDPRNCDFKDIIVPMSVGIGAFVEQGEVVGIR